MRRAFLSAFDHCRSLKPLTLWNSQPRFQLAATDSPAPLLPCFYFFGSNMLFLFSLGTQGAGRGVKGAPKTLAAAWLPTTCLELMATRVNNVSEKQQQVYVVQKSSSRSKTWEEQIEMFGSCSNPSFSYLGHHYNHPGHLQTQSWG